MELHKLAMAVLQSIWQSRPTLTLWAASGWLIGVWVIFCQVFDPKSGPDGSGQPSGFIWSKFQAKPSILDPFRSKFDVFGPDRNFGQPVFGLGLALDRPHCSWEARPDFNICLVSTEDITAVRTQIIENCRNRVQNQPFGLKLGPNES